MMQDARGEEILRYCACLLLCGATIGLSSPASADVCAQNVWGSEDDHCAIKQESSPKSQGGPLTITGSAGLMFLDPRGRTLSARFGKYESPSFSYPGNRVGHPLSVGTLGVRLEVPFVHFMYAGIQSEVGFGASSLPATQSGEYSVQSGSGFSVGYAGGAFLGLRAALGYVSLRAESLFGVRSIKARQSVIDPFNEERTALIGLEVWSIEPRAFFDAWLTRRVTLSAYAGFNAFHYVDCSGGLSLGFHLKDYDGAFLFF